MNQDNFNRDKSVPLYDPILVAPTVNFTSTKKVDTQGFESCTVKVYSGLAGDTHDASNNIYFELWECDTSGGTYTKVSDDDVFSDDDPDAVNKFGLLDDDATDEGIIRALGYKGTKRFLELRGVVTGTLTNGVVLAAWANLSHARIQTAGALAQSS